MKAEELFIGALVRVNHDNLCIKKGTIIEVRAVNADDKLINKGLVGAAHCRPLDYGQFDGGIWCEYLEPIPLTPEILEKNGWIWEDKDALYLYLKINGCKVVECLPHISDTAIHCVLAYRNTRLRITLMFVHQLQHCLRLVGIEKEITI